MDRVSDALKHIEIRRSNRRTLSLEVTHDARVLVRAPLFVSRAEIERFVMSKRTWIEKSLQKVMDRQDEKNKSGTQLVGVTYGRITIRTQKTRWGSCSSQGNLNFNSLLLFAPEAVQDYVVVHELCHRKEMNHSKRFWREVAKVVPDYKVHKKWLKDYGSKIMNLNR